MICPSPPARISSPSFLFHTTIWSLFSSTLSPWLVLFQRCENKVSLLCFYKRGELQMFRAGLASTGSEDTKPFRTRSTGKKAKGSMKAFSAKSQSPLSARHRPRVTTKAEGTRTSVRLLCHLPATHLRDLPLSLQSLLGKIKIKTPLLVRVWEFRRKLCAPGTWQE